MTFALRPMKLGEILDQGFTIYRKNFWQLAGITILPSLIVISLYVADLLWIHLGRRMYGRPADRMDALGYNFLVWLIFSHVAAFVHPLFYPAVVKTTTGILFDEPVSVTGALRFNFKRWHSYLWIDLLKNAAAPLLPEAIGFGVGVLMAFTEDAMHFDSGQTALGVVGVVIILAVSVLSFWIAACLAFAIPAAAVEGVRGFKAIRRSWHLSRGARFQVFVTWMTTFFLIMFSWYAIEFIVQSVESFFYGTLHLHFVNQRFYLVSYYTLAAVYNAAVGPIYPVLLVLLYLNQRVRKEGYDVERMIDAAGLMVSVSTASGGVVPEPAAVQAVSSPPEGASVQPAGESPA
jgi:hypothetical protein